MISKIEQISMHPFQILSFSIAMHTVIVIISVLQQRREKFILIQG